MITGSDTSLRQFGQGLSGVDQRDKTALATGELVASMTAETVERALTAAIRAGRIHL